MYFFISPFRAVCTLVLLVHKNGNAIAPNQNTALYQESAPRLLMVRERFFLDLQWDLQADMGSRDAIVVRALASQRCGPSSISAPCHAYVG